MSEKNLFPLPGFMSPSSSEKRKAYKQAPVVNLKVLPVKQWLKEYAYLLRNITLLFEEGSYGVFEALMVNDKWAGGKKFLLEKDADFLCEHISSVDTFIQGARDHIKDLFENQQLAPQSIQQLDMCQKQTQEFIDKISFPLLGTQKELRQSVVESDYFNSSIFITDALENWLSFKHETDVVGFYSNLKVAAHENTLKHLSFPAQQLFAGSLVRSVLKVLKPE